MIDPVETEKRRLERLDSPRRVAWLREQVHGYIVDLAAHSYFRLTCWCAGFEISDPKDEALGAAVGFAASHDLTAEECKVAFEAEWTAAMKIAVLVGEKLKIAALSNIKIAGHSRGVEAALRVARDRFTPAWPYLTNDDLTAIAAGFQRPSIKRRVA